MAVKNTQNPKVYWDQEEFSYMASQWSPMRCVADEAMLRDVFALAGKAPLFAEALQWAQDHGIRFFIDHHTKTNLGYYTPGTGVVGIAADALQNSAGIVCTLTHEIRHAWQDYHGLLPKSYSDFAQCFIKTALIEADAEAYGARAREQYQQILVHGRVIDADAPGQEAARLLDGFMAWFSGRRPAIYGKRLSEAYARKYKLPPPPSVKKKKNFLQRIFKGAAEWPVNNTLEFNPIGIRKKSDLDIFSIDSILPLGKGFGDEPNYLTAIPRDTWMKEILNPSLANAFWGAATQEQQRLTADLHKAYVREKFSPRWKKAHHPWP